jgi:hypothetical protein
VKVPCEVYEVGSLVVPRIGPATASVAVGVGTVAEHWPSISGSGLTSGTGGTVSAWIVIGTVAAGSPGSTVPLPFSS